MRTTRASGLFSIGSMAVDVVLTVAALFPRVEDPLPATIGLEFPFATAGAGGVLGGAFYAGESKSGRDDAIRFGGRFGFWLGASFYVISFVNQVVSTQ